MVLSMSPPAPGPPLKLATNALMRTPGEAVPQSMHASAKPGTHRRQ